jgi:hypothetical protein
MELIMLFVPDRAGLLGRKPNAKIAKAKDKKSFAPKFRQR